MVASDDPEIELLRELNIRGLAQLRVMTGGVGVERFAEWCFKTADSFVDEATNGRVWVESVTVYEHEDNFASYNRSTIKANETVDVQQPPAEESTETTGTTPVPPPATYNPDQHAGDARVGPGVKRPGLSDPFAGTTWGRS